jgi:hypothetical protein
MDIIFEPKIQTRTIILQELYNYLFQKEEDIDFYKILKEYSKIKKCEDDRQRVIEIIKKFESKILTEMF